MADLWKELGDRVKAVAGNWASITALGSFALYVLGYLSLRFHLTALGIGTDLTVLDERYLFAGAKFLVYLVSAVPIVVLLVLVLVAVIYLPYRILLPAKARAKVSEFVGSRWKKIWAWWSVPTRLSLTGVALSVLMIQLVMRQSFFFSNLLVAPKLPEPAWLHPLLLGETAGLWALYFPGLVAATAVTAGLLLYARAQKRQTYLSHFLCGLLAFLVAVQVLFLPVNYGILIVDKTMPKVAELGQMQSLKDGQEAWLVWEGKQGVTYLVRDTREQGRPKRLVTLPRKDITKMEITGYDPILRVLFQTNGPSSKLESQQ